MSKLYKIKPFEWVVNEYGCHLLIGSPYYIVGVESKRFYLQVRDSGDDFGSRYYDNLDELKAHAEHLWNERLIAALEEVKP